MKSFYFTKPATLLKIILFLLVLTNSVLIGQWRQQESGTTKELKAVSSYDGQNYFAAGADGTILHSPDQGETWAIKNSNTTEDLNDIKMLSETKGIAVGNNGIALVTTDGGDTWNKTDLGTTDDLNSVDGFGFTEDNIQVWVVGEKAGIYNTDDLGKNWNKVQPLYQFDTFYSVSFWKDVLKSIGGESSFYLKSGGSQWLYVDMNNLANVMDIHFHDPNIGWAVGASGNINKTETGGSAWSSKPTGTTNNLNGLAFSDADNGYAAGDNGTVISTNDGGESWNVEQTETTEDLQDIEIVQGNKGVAVGKGGRIITNKPEETNKAALDISINPPEAGDNGCSTIPGPGQHEYELNTAINLYAVPNQEKGWYFKEWTGDVSGSDLIVNVTMDDNKIAVANFVHLELTVSGKKDREVLCPKEAMEEEVMILPVTLCASEDDGWNVASIEFRASGIGNELNDVKKISILRGGEVLDFGSFSADDGTYYAIFNPPISINPGECTSLSIFYEFKFDDENFALDTTKTFRLETKAVVANPWDYPEGKISGQANNEELTVARVMNSKGYGFSGIQKAIDSPTTGDGDTCYVCEGEYSESISFDGNEEKGMHIVSIKGKEKTILKNLNSYNFLGFISIIGAKNGSFNGFTVKNENYEYDDSGIDLIATRKFAIKNNTIEKFNVGIDLANSRQCVVEENLIKGNAGKNAFIQIKLYADSNHVLYNSFENIDSEDKILTIDESDFNFIFENVSEGEMNFELSDRSDFNKILYNESKSDKSGYISLKDSRDNEISNNTNFRLHIRKESWRNKINDNTLTGIIIFDSPNNEILNNEITGETREILDEWAAILIDSKSYNTEIKENKIYNNKSAAIEIDSDNGKITKNEIYNNKGTGVQLFSSDNTKVTENDIYTNGEHGIYVHSSKNIEITSNSLTRHNKPQKDGEPVAAGIYIKSVSTGKIKNNSLYYNTTAIIGTKGKEITVEGNEIVENKGKNTGIHLYDSEVDIINNKISSNGGAGIVCEDGSDITLTSNNIFGNDGFEFENADPNISIDLSGNYWGDANGPGDGDVTGNVNVNDWLAAPVKLVAISESDTVYSISGTSDSTSIYFRNLDNPDESFQVTVNDDKGWLQGPANFNVEVEDSTSAKVVLKYSIPSEAGEELAKVIFEGTAQSDQNLVARDSFYISTYSQMLETLILSPDSSTMMPGDTLQFEFTAFDQLGKIMQAEPDWQTTNGTIDPTGLFIAGETDGQVTVTASNNNYSKEAYLYIANEEPLLTVVNIDPKTITLNQGEVVKFNVTGRNQFNFPHEFEHVWDTQGGTIDLLGYYTAGNSEGTYTVTVTDSVGTTIGEATVEVTGITNIKEVEELPTSYVLKQNYPNPFNPTTTIEYAIPFNSNVKLEIYDILGQRIELLINNVQSAGYKRINWNAGKYASGVYIVRLIANPLENGKHKFTSIKKMLLLR